MKSTNHSFQNCKLLKNRLNRYRDPNITKLDHVYAICCRPEVAGGIISGEKVNTTECCLVEF